MSVSTFGPRPRIETNLSRAPSQVFAIRQSPRFLVPLVTRSQRANTKDLVGGRCICVAVAPVVPFVRLLVSFAVRTIVIPALSVSNPS